MHVDPLTLMIPGSFAWALAAVFLLGAWFRYQHVSALLWWSASSLASAIGLAVLIVGLATAKTQVILFGVGITTIAPALLWGGVRRFGGRSVSLVLLLGGVAAWFAVGALTLFADVNPQKWMTLVNFTGWYIYLPAAVWELWSGRHEVLKARWALIALFVIHAIVFVGGSYDLLSGVLIIDQPPELLSWFGATHFETILFAMGCAVLLPLLCDERTKRQYVEAAGIDVLTGIANRRFLLEGAERIFMRCRIDASPVCVVMFDLDHFKTINDNLGLAGGDYVLRGFVDVIRPLLRPSDLFGRYGGEEFVLVLPNVSIEAGYVIAERARCAFAEAYRFVDGRQVGATVSAGVALAAFDGTLEGAIVAADAAMYEAKHGGRNRVQRVETGEQPAGRAKVFRIA